MDEEEPVPSVPGTTKRNTEKEKTAEMKIPPININIKKDWFGMRKIIQTANIKSRALHKLKV